MPTRLENLGFCLLWRDVASSYFSSWGPAFLSSDRSTSGASPSSFASLDLEKPKTLHIELGEAADGKLLLQLGLSIKFMRNLNAICKS